jgi:transposase
MALRDLRLCSGCVEKMRQIDRLKRERIQLKAQVRRLKARLGREDRHIHERPFGSSTSSAREPFKAGATPEDQARKGGAKPGHKGHGRSATARLPALPDVRRLSTGSTCPCCGEALEQPSERVRRTIAWEPSCPHVRTTVHEDRWCPNCRMTVRARTPGVLPDSMLENSALGTVAGLHYLQGLTLGHTARITGINKSTLVAAMHRLATVLAPAVPGLQGDLRAGAAIFADETTWRIDGGSGYAWMMRSLDTMAYAFRPTRSGTVAQELLGTEPLNGVLQTDRYVGYNALPIRRQFCFAHLLRDLKDLGEDFTDHPEVNAFVGELAPLLKAAMGLPGKERRLPQYRRKARRLKQRILKVIGRSARHPGIQCFQAIFRENGDKLYHWAEDPIVRAENNTAERSLRPTVIARKLSFGSQSLRGARTREIIMTVLGTLQLRAPDPLAILRHALDTIALQPERAPEIGSILFDEPAAISA